MYSHSPGESITAEQAGPLPADANRSRRIATAAAVAALLIVGAVGTLAFHSITELNEARQQLDRSHALIQTLDQFLLSLDDTETGQRGFVLTGDTAFLKPHLEGVERSRHLISQLRVLAATDPAQQQDLDELVKVADRKVAHSRRVVATMLSDGPAAATEIIRSQRGRLYMDSVRALVADMQDHENGLLEQHRISDQRSLIRTGLGSALGLLTAAALAVIAVFLVRRTLFALEEGRRSAAYAHTLIDSTSDGIYGLDSEGRVTLANKSMATALGYDVEELVGSHGHSLFHHTRPDGRPYPLEECPLYVALRGDAPGKIDHEIIWRRDGTPIPVEYSVAKVVDPHGKPGAVVSFRDITDRQAAHDALKAAMESAEASNKAKSDFLARMSHELRTPLNSVIGFANILLRNKSGGISEKELAYLERIQKNGVSLLALINDILDLSKIEAGKMEVDFAPADLGEMVRDVVAQFEPQITGKPITLKVSVPHDLRPIDTDSGRLRQVLSNLITNGIKFTEAGTVMVSVRANPETGAPTAIEVTDTGIGIPPDRIGAIFDAFEQAERSTARKFGGTGLGLPISRSLCALLGYDLRVVSREGHGSTFIIDLAPVAPAEEILTPILPQFDTADADDRALLSGKTVLVIDDSADARLIVASHVAQLGGTSIHAASGSQGLELARQNKPDLITLDLLMPRMDGSEVLRILKDDPVLCRIPVIVISAVANERQSLVGALSLLPKPLNTDELRRAIKQEVGLGRVLIVEDDPDTQALLSSYAYEEGASEVHVAGDGDAALAYLKKIKPDLILLDLVLPRRDGLEVLARLMADASNEFPVLIVTSKELSAEQNHALRLGSIGVLRKGEHLERDIRRALRDFVGRRRGVTANT